MHVDWSRYAYKSHWMLDAINAEICNVAQERCWYGWDPGPPLFTPPHTSMIVNAQRCSGYRQYLLKLYKPNADTFFANFSGPKQQWSYNVRTGLLYIEVGRESECEDEPLVHIRI